MPFPPSGFPLSFHSKNTLLPKTCKASLGNLDQGRIFTSSSLFCRGLSRPVIERPALGETRLPVKSSLPFICGRERSGSGVFLCLLRGTLQNLLRSELKRFLHKSKGLCSALERLAGVSMSLCVEDTRCFLPTSAACRHQSGQQHVFGWSAFRLQSGGIGGDVRVF